MYWFYTVLLAAIVVAIAMVAAGRGASLREAQPDRRGLQLPDHALTAADLNGLRLDLGFRGYRMDDVDDLLDRIAVEIAERDAYIAELRRELANRTRPAGARVSTETAEDADGT